MSTTLFLLGVVEIMLAQNTLEELQEKAIQGAVQRVSPTLVQIETTGGTEVISAGAGGAGKRRPGPAAGPGVRKGSGPTTGVIVSADGYVISSAFNFANKPTSIIVSTMDNKRYIAKVVSTAHGYAFKNRCDESSHSRSTSYFQNGSGANGNRIGPNLGRKPWCATECKHGNRFGLR